MAGCLKVLGGDRSWDRRRISAIDLGWIWLPARGAKSRIVEDRMVHVDEPFSYTVLDGREAVRAELVYNKSSVC